MDLIIVILKALYRVLELSGLVINSYSAIIKPLFQ